MTDYELKSHGERTETLNSPLFNNKSKRNNLKLE